MAVDSPPVIEDLISIIQSFTLIPGEICKINRQ